MTAIDAVIPVWNRAPLIGRAIDSVLAQELPPGCSINVVVVDDGSTDALTGTLRPYGGRVTCLRHDRNRGAAAARNTGVAAATGDYVAFLDSDDIWLPGKVAAQLAAMRAHRWAASCTAYRLARAGRPEIVSPPHATGALGLADLVWGCFVSPGSTLMCERAVFAEVGPLDTALRRLEDWDWLLRYARGRDLGFLAQPLARIEITPHANAQHVVDALRRLREKHAAVLPPGDRRHFAAALAMERAAAFYRQGRLLAALPALARSLCLAPVRNRSLAAVWHNRFAPK